MKTHSFFVLAAVAFAGMAQAGSLRCTDVGSQRLSYSFTQTDGGAAIAPTEVLTFDRDTLIHRGPGVKEEVSQAAFRVEERGSKELHKVETANKNHDQTAFIAKATVLKFAGDEQPQQRLYEGLVLCQRSTYKGPPIPAPPKK